ncbi:hypothetical protein ACFWRY_20340 [Streptomyces albidoflavus]
MSTPTPTAPAAPQSAPQTSPAPQQTPTPQAPAQAAQQGDPGTKPQDVASLPDWAQKLIKDTRAEAADYRTRYQQASQTPAAPAPPAPAAQPTAEAPEGDLTRLPKWAQQALTDSTAAAKRAAVQAAVIQAAPAAGADVARLLDSASFTAAVAQVDPTDTAAVTETIKNAVAAQPWLSTVPQTPGKGGADFTDPGPGAVTAEQFAAMSYAERVDLHQSDPETYRRLAGS